MKYYFKALIISILLVVYTWGLIELTIFKFYPIVSKENYDYFFDTCYSKTYDLYKDSANYYLDRASICLEQKDTMSAINYKLEVFRFYGGMCSLNDFLKKTKNKVNYKDSL